MYTKFKEYMPTELSFYKDTKKAHDRVYVDNIIKHERFGTCIILGSTLFYPQGGGQKGDKGKIIIDDKYILENKIPKRILIKDTKKDGGYVLHLVDESCNLDIDSFNELLMGELVEIEIDIDFRKKQMRLHSLAHLIHFFTEQVAKKPLPYPVSSDLQELSGINKYDISDLVPTNSGAEIKEKFLAFCSGNHEITTYPDAEKEGFRYWKCESYVVPCGGAHLNNTSEIGDFEIDISTKKEQTSIKFKLL